MLISHLSKRLAVLVSKNQGLCNTSLPHLKYLQQIANVSSSSLSLLSFSSCNTSKLFSTTEQDENRAFLVSYLTNSCGLSSERAALISLSSVFRFRSVENLNAALNLLRDNGLTDTQITKVVNEAPNLLAYADPEKRLLPKFQFLYDAGFDRKDLQEFVCKNPSFMLRSLEHHIIPLFEFMKSVLGSHEKVVLSLRRGSWDLAQVDLNECLAPNTLLLQEIGMPTSIVAAFMTYRPRTLTRKHSDFKKAVEEALKLGFGTSKTSFINAVDVCVNKGTMDRNIEILKQWGWSEDDITSAFRSHPQFLLVSEKKLSRTLDFLVNKIGYEMKKIVRYPLAMCFSLEKRIIPRCLVIKVLLHMGLIRDIRSLISVLAPTEKCFLEMFVTRYSDKAPQLLRVYQGKVDFFKQCHDN